VKNQQMHQLFIQFIDYVWYLLHVSALHCHPQGEFLVPSERCLIEVQSKEYCGWACCVLWRGAWRSADRHLATLIDVCFILGSKYPTIREII
jgi:hypothetical protein